MTSMRFQGYAPGAIKTREHLTDLIVEARKGKKAIRLYAVQQGGRMAEVFLTSKSKIENGAAAGIETFSCWHKATWSGERFYKTHHCLGDLNIPGKDGRHSGHNIHQLFSNRRLATEYSERLKHDVGYQAAVKAHHEHCARMFGRFGW